MNNKSIEIKAEWFLISFYDGDTHNCFDEDRYDFELFKSAFDYYNTYNAGYEKGMDYVKLYAYINDEIGLVLIGDFNPIL